ncbi:hypothetical protein [Cyanobium sp. Morenito 9A2]|uniref:hypothetical protein n=1 Tax=Cyanobium sp. Morenito 9A2 TaxID=2823718 RepID=UPI0020CCA723|nr:hypothetical protein [Cyanobium sp. Morenito 9A2]MCP9848617.1 hypothetical protein [Cyanobium sp. Morenito 9A2]
MAVVIRKELSQLNRRDFSLYRAICRKLEELQHVIKDQTVLFSDFQEISAAMMDRCFLVEWLRGLRLPPSIAYIDSGLSEASEDQILLDPPE